MSSLLLSLLLRRALHRRGLFSFIKDGCNIYPSAFENLSEWFARRDKVTMLIQCWL